MLSARHWKSRRACWHALVFWVWLAGFVFSQAASDLFHAPHCAERLRLQWAGHSTSASASSATTSVFHLESECAACWLQHDAAALWEILAPFLLALLATIGFARFGRLNASSYSHSPIARGPPVWARAAF